MNIYKRTISLRDFGVPDENGIPRKGILVDGENSFLPHYTENGKKVVSWATFNHYKRWLKNFIVESEIFTVKKRTFGNKDTYFLADSRKFEDDYCNAATFGEQWNVLQKWVRAAESRMGDKYLVFRSRYEARTQTGENECRRGVKIFVHPDADVFFDMFGNTENAARLLMMNGEGSVPPIMDVPVYISEDIRDLGIYDIYNTNTSGESVDPTSKLVGRTVSADGNIYVESQLKTLLRTKKTFNEDGDELPFCNVEGVGNEMQYLVNSPTDVIYSDGVFSYTILKSIKFYRTTGSTSPVVSYTVSGSPKCDSSIPSSGVVEFIYYVGVAAEGGNGGIKYRDRYYYTIENDAEYGNYIAIDYLSVDKPEDYDPDKSYAMVESTFNAYSDSIKEGYMIKNDAFIDMQDIKVDYDDVYIERGTSAAYEAFNVLGETNTIEDIENYRDDWFRIKGKND